MCMLPLIRYIINVILMKPMEVFTDSCNFEFTQYASFFDMDDAFWHSRQ